jgi:hypothetical protein
MMQRLATALLVATCPLVSHAAPDFERDVAPLLIRRCLECHHTTGAAGGLVLTQRETVDKGGDSGAALVPGKPEESALLKRVLSGEMPPPKHEKSQRLPDAEIQLLKDWIATGAKWPAGRVLDPYERTTETRAGRDWWSFQPVRRPRVPGTPAEFAVHTPVDAFIVEKLAVRGWQPAPPADRRTLYRRVSFDLLGLPPTAEELDQFAADTSPDSYARLVDRLLASPHYGERWGRYWLDVVRYADTCGYERDQEKPGAWRYRDWVVDALNQDLPYDRFVTEQLAGDELPDRTERSVVATGFIRLGTWNDEPNDADEYKFERLEDMVHATTTAFLGLTVKCARCHDHKFDPIPQVDYYRVAGAFWAGYLEPRDRNWLGGPNPQELGVEAFGWTDRGRDVPALHLLKKGDHRHPGAEVAPGQLSLVPALDRPVQAPPEGSRTTQRRRQLAEWIADTTNPLTPRVVVNRLWQHHFGQGLMRTPDNLGFNGDRPTHPELLDWLAAELVQPMSGPGWSLKRLQRQIVLSATYQQASDHPQQAEYDQVDAGNRLWWRMERRRLDADALRDAVLAVSDRLDVRMGGPSFKPTVPAEALEGLSRKSGAWTASPTHEQQRRSLYIFLQRSLLPPLLTTFDQADTTLPCGQRDVTTVAPQALALLNNEVIHDYSRSLAERVLSAASRDDAGRVEVAWRFALGRSPTSIEREAALRHLTEQTARFERTRAPRSARQLAWESLCHVLINTNEFIYVD